MTNPAETPTGKAGPNKPRRAVPPVPPPRAPTQAGGPAKDGKAPKPEGTAKTDAPKADPTRYGDWEKNGRCIDF